MSDEPRPYASDHLTRAERLATFVWTRTTPELDFDQEQPYEPIDVEQPEP